MSSTEGDSSETINLSPVLLEDDGDDDQQDDYLGLRMCEGGGDENKDDCEIDGDEVGSREIDQEENFEPNPAKNNGGGGILMGKP